MTNEPGIPMTSEPGIPMTNEPGIPRTNEPGILMSLVGADLQVPLCMSWSSFHA